MSSKNISNTDFYIVFGDNDPIREKFIIVAGSYSEAQIVSALQSNFNTFISNNRNKNVPNVTVSMVNGYITLSGDGTISYSIEFGDTPNGSTNLGCSTTPGGESGIALYIPVTFPYSFINGRPLPRPAAAPVGAGPGPVELPIARHPG